jgi:hypothetical protein
MRRLDDPTPLLTSLPLSDFLFPRRHPTLKSTGVCLWLLCDYSVIALFRCSVARTDRRANSPIAGLKQVTMQVATYFHTMRFYPIRVFNAPLDGHKTFLLHYLIIITLFPTDILIFSSIVPLVSYTGYPFFLISWTSSSQMPVSIGLYIITYRQYATLLILCR